MTLLLALALSLAASAAPREPSTAKRGRNVASVDVDGSHLEVSIRNGRSKTTASVELTSTCSSGPLGTVLARELAQNGGVFRRHPNGAKMTLASTPAAVEALENGFASLLETGKRRRGEHEGFTAFGGFSVRVGRIPSAGKSRTVERAGHRGGSTTTVTGLPGGGAKIVRETTRGKGVRDVTVVELLGDGSVSVERTLTFGRHAGRVELSESSEFDGAGNRTGGIAKLHTGGGVVFENDQSSGGGGGGDGGGTPSGGDGGGSGDNDEHESNQGSGAAGVADTPSGGEGGGGSGENDETGSDQTSGGAPTMRAGTLTVPGMAIGHATVAGVINWNRLGAAVSTPDPSGGERGVTPDRGRGPGGPCTHLSNGSFDPDPKYLRPNKRGFVTDPVPALREP